MMYSGRYKQTQSYRLDEEEMFPQKVGRILCLDWKKIGYETSGKKERLQEKRIEKDMAAGDKKCVYFLQWLIGGWTTGFRVRKASQLIAETATAWYCGPGISEKSPGDCSTSAAKVSRAMWKQKCHDSQILSNCKLGQTHTNSGTW